MKFVNATDEPKIMGGDTCKYVEELKRFTIRRNFAEMQSLHVQGPRYM